MFPVGLHSLGRHGPNLIFPVDFPDRGTNDLARSGGGQDRKFKRPRRNSVLLVQFDQECRQFSIGEGTVMFDFAYLRTRRQKLVEMSAPTRRIVAMAVAAHGCPAEN